MAASPDSLDPRHVFLVDGGLKIFVWYGRKCKNVLKSKARLMAEKVNKIERKDKVTFSCIQISSLFILMFYVDVLLRLKSITALLE